MAKPKIVLRLNIRGPQYGRCNICGHEGKLTNDHTPPKSCGGITDAELLGLHEKLAAEGERWTKPRRFQAGVCYRTLCERCNGLLGRDYDPTLAEMSRQVRAVAKSSLRLPPQIRLEVSPGAVTRSVRRNLPVITKEIVYLSTRPLLPSQWPEAPDDRSFILYGQEAVVALPAPRGRRM